MYGIIGAMKSEVEELIAHLSDRSESCYNGVVFHQGMLCGRIPAVIAESGVGKVNAAVTAVTMAERFHPRAIINTGVGGALAPELEVKDVALASALVQHDMDTSAIGDPIGYVSGPGKILFETDPALLDAAVRTVTKKGLGHAVGVIASGDQFIADREKKEQIRERFGAIVCEMEGAAIAHACYLTGTPVLVVRTVSDRADGASPLDFPTFAREAARVSAELVRELLLSLS